MKKEQDFEKAVLDSIDDLKKEGVQLKQQVTEYMGRIRKIVEGRDREMREFETKLYKTMMAMHKLVEAQNKSMESTQKMINASSYGKLGPVLERIDRAIKSGKL